jgi:hypothetical protein
VQNTKLMFSGQESFDMNARLAIERTESGGSNGTSPPVWRRISRYALQQRSRIDATDRAEGTRRLMWAILKDTLNCYHLHADASTVHGQRLFREAERWLLSKDLSWVFSFENVCAVLDIDSEYLRTELRRWRRTRHEHA